jgi:hypothetical protein
MHVINHATVEGPGPLVVNGQSVNIWLLSNDSLPVYQSMYIPQRPDRPGMSRLDCRISRHRVALHPAYLVILTRRGTCYLPRSFRYRCSACAERNRLRALASYDGISGGEWTRLLAEAVTEYAEWCCPQDGEDIKETEELSVQFVS